MYKIMLVDDDPIVLVQLKKMIQWEKLNCEMVAEASDGKQAIEAFNTYKPDIILTDISMPRANGIDLINYINNGFKETKIIVLSAYNDFEYVRNSLKNGAVDYLLKYQITETNINDIIQKTIWQINTENKDKDGFSISKEREHLIYELVNKEMSDTAYLEELIHKTDLDWVKGELILAICGIDVYFEDPSKIPIDDTTIRMLIDETIKYYHNFFLVSLDKGIILLVLQAKGNSTDEIVDLAKQIRTVLKRFCDINLSFVISDFLSDYKKLKPKSDHIKHQLIQEYFNGNKNFLSQNTTNTEKYILRLNPEQEQQLTELILLGQNDIKNYISKIFSDIKNSGIMKHQLQVFYVEFINYIVKKVNEYQLDNMSMFFEINPYDIFDKFHTLEDMENSLLETLFTLQHLAKEKRQILKQYSICEKISDYIRENYQHKISLQNIAEKFAISPSYLSRIFKKTQGVNVINFVNQIRMEHAKEKILQGNTSLQEVALDVGIHNYNYFYLLFKETYGFTPSEYVKIVEQNNENR